MEETNNQPTDEQFGRVLGQFPLSIATSLAIESAVGIHPELPTPPSMPIRQFNELWINMRTLFRNLYGSLPKGLAETITVPELVHGLLEEMEYVPDILRHYLGSKPIKVVYYYSSYKDMDKRYPKALLRTDNTDKQKFYTLLLHKTMEQLARHHHEQIRWFDRKLKGGNMIGKTAIITHIAYDLLSHKEFGHLVLLESHTGKFKNSSQWWSKYYNSKGLERMPFREDLIQVFGDSETFRPLDSHLRKALIEIAEKRQWSNVTTKARIEMGIDDLQNPDHKQLMRSILV